MLRRGLILVVVVLAGCGPSSYSAFRDQLDVRWCDWQIRCGEVGASEPERCGVPTVLGLIAPGTVDVVESIAEKRMLFHPDNATECLDSVKHAPCDPTQAAVDWYRRCHGVVGPAVEVGGACFGDEECVGGACVRADCGGTCTAFASPGAPCGASGGLPEQTCDPTVQFCGPDGTCWRKAAHGAACSADDQCLFDHVCLDGKCADPPRPGRDDVCGTNTPPCDDGLYCHPYGTCQPLVGSGGACLLPTACDASLVCLGGQCASWLDVGSACTPGMPSGCPGSQTCAGGSCASAAAARLGPLARCSADPDCAAGLACIGGYCNYTGGIGALCMADRECDAALTCDGATHTCRKPVTCPAGP
jgi:hypothetical protein